MIHLNAFYPWIAGFFALIATPPVWAVGAWMRRRAIRRNHVGQCARCAEPLDRANGEAEFLIEGLAVCEPCAGRFAARLRWIAPVLAFSAAVALGWATISLWPYMVSDRGIDTWSVVGVIAPGALLLIVAQRVKNRMRLANEAARLRVGVLATLVSAGVAELIARAPQATGIDRGEQVLARGRSNAS